MSNGIANLTRRQLWLGLTMISVTLAIGLLMASFLISFFFVHDSFVSSVTLNGFFFAIAINVLANGILATLKIFDWFEARKAKSNA